MSNREQLRAALTEWDNADFDKADNTITIGDQTVTNGFLEAFKSDGPFGQLVGLAKQMLDYADENSLTDEELESMFSSAA